MIAGDADARPARRVLLVALSGSLLAALYTYVEGKLLHAVIHV